MEQDSSAHEAASLHDGRILRLLENALLEDVGMGDVTSDATLETNARAGGEFLVKADGVVAGLDIVAATFKVSDDRVVFKRRVADGAVVKAGAVIANVEGPARGILGAERVALNFLQRMSGIATMTHQYVEAVAGTGAKIIDTRKTVPGLRMLDKMAVRLGGGANHRFGLDDMVLIKDNHIVAAGGITAAVGRCLEYLKDRHLKIGIEVETTTLAMVEEALACKGLQRIMLDNFDLSAMRRAVQRINHAVEVEASGGVSLTTVRGIAETGVDFISVGALTHSVIALDISLELIAGKHEPHA